MKCTFHFLSILALLTLASKSNAHESFGHHLRNLAVEKIDCQIASVAIDYYGNKPPDHEMRCSRLNSDECFDIEFDPNAHPGQGKPHYPTGSIVKFRGSPGSVNPGRCRKLLVTAADLVSRGVARGLFAPQQWPCLAAFCHNRCPLSHDDDCPLHECTRSARWYVGQ